MKIVDRKTFLTLPAGTVFSKCKPWYFEGLCIKGDTIHGDKGPIDFFYQDIGPAAIESSGSTEWAALLDESKASGRELKMDYACESRDGCFDDEDLFAVFSAEDVTALIERLRNCIDTTGPK